MAAFLSVEGVSKRFGAVAAVDHADLALEQGRMLALLGPSGCGKTTLLRLIAGLNTADAGTIRLDGDLLTGPATMVPPERRRIGVVFQDFALFPHMNVAANVRFGLPKGLDKRRRVDELLRLVRLEGLERRMPHELSGGQQQRVAIARALAAEPRLMLLDEPFSNLDPSIRRSVRAEVRQLIDAIGMTAIVVTHDQDEALSLAHRVAVMMDGRVLQVGTPEEVYFRPTSRAVAGFLGEANVLRGTANGSCVESALGSSSYRTSMSGPVEVMVRAESIEVESDPHGDGEIAGVEFFGHHQILNVRLRSGEMVKARQPATHHFEPGERVRLRVAGDIQVYQG
ncbi:MAG: ABC transporter ATP-binding protein [Dehalococcoidia bacterium]